MGIFTSYTETKIRIVRVKEAYKYETLGEVEIVITKTLCDGGFPLGEPNTRRVTIPEGSEIVL